jgi:hypothetical protein
MTTVELYTVNLLYQVLSVLYEYCPALNLNFGFITRNDTELAPTMMGHIRLEISSRCMHNNRRFWHKCSETIKRREYD